MIVTFSGIDCCGKSTQIDLLSDYLRSCGYRPIRLWIRGGYTPRLCAVKNGLRALLGKEIIPSGDGVSRQAFMRAAFRRRLWLYLACLDLWLECVLHVRWLRARGFWVLCDRYIEDTEIDFSMYFPDEHVSEWWSWRLLRRFAVNPDRAFFLDLSFAESSRRSMQKNEPFPENDGRRQMRASYYAATRHCQDWCVLDASRSIHELHNDVLRQITAR